MSDFVKHDVSSLAGIRLAPGLSSLGPLLHQWIALQQEYIQVVRDDLPWWYSERASVGLLAAAAARSGWVALEEFQHSKADMSRLGRCDLWISRRMADALEQYYFEAKFTYYDARSNGDLQELVGRTEKALKDALAEAQRTQKRSIALVFCPVLIPPSRVSEGGVRTVVEEIDAHLRALHDESLAWVFPEAAFALTSFNGKYSPGVVLRLAQV